MPTIYRLFIFVFTEYDEAGILEDSQQTEAAKIREIFNTGEKIENKDPIEIYKKIKQKARALKNRGYQIVLAVFIPQLRALVIGVNCT